MFGSMFGGALGVLSRRDMVRQRGYQHAAAALLSGSSSMEELQCEIIGRIDLVHDQGFVDGMRQAIRDFERLRLSWEVDLIDRLARGVHHRDGRTGNHGLP